MRLCSYNVSSYFTNSLSIHINSEPCKGLYVDFSIKPILVSPPIFGHFISSWLGSYMVGLRPICVDRLSNCRQIGPGCSKLLCLLLFSYRPPGLLKFSFLNSHFKNVDWKMVFITRPSIWGLALSVLLFMKNENKIESGPLQLLCLHVWLDISARELKDELE